LDDALAICNKAAQTNPNDFRPYVAMGYFYQAQGKDRSASAAFGTAIRLKPDVKALYLSKAKIDRFSNASDEAVATCRQAVKVFPEFAECYEMIGEVLSFKKERRDEAIDAYRSAIGAGSRSPGSYLGLGALLDQNDDKKGAEEAYRQ